MHILILPSEEYIPKNKPIAGVFQHDQAKVLIKNNNVVGAISFSFKFSFFGLIKAIFKRNKNKHYQHSFFYLLRVLIAKTLFPKKSSLNFQKIDGVNVLRCDGFWGVKNSKQPLSKYELWLKYGEFAIERYIDKFGKPDIIHAHNMVYAGLMANRLASMFNIPLVITEHSSEYAMSEISFELENLLLNLTNSNKFIFAVSPALQSQLTERFIITDNKIRCLPNVIDPKIEAIPLSKGNKRTEKFKILNIANLIPLKGQKDLINAFYNAFIGHNNVELVIGGKGYLEEELKALVNKLQMQDKVNLIGYITRDQVIEEMDKSDVFVLPSHYETFGVVLIEALSRGVPLISTYCGGPEGIVNESNGFLVEPKNKEELEKALIRMFNEHKNYNSVTLRKSCLDKFGEVVFYKKLSSIYKELIK